MRVFTLPLFAVSVCLCVLPVPVRGQEENNQDQQVKSTPAAPEKEQDKTAVKAANEQAARLLEEIHNLKPPVFDPDKAGDPDYQDEFQKEFEAAAAREAELIYQLYKADPDNSELDELLPKLWARTAIGDDEIEGYDPLANMKEFLEKYPDRPAAHDARLYLPLGYLYRITDLEDEQSLKYRDEAFRGIDEFLEKYPDEDVLTKLRLVWMKFRYVKGDDSAHMREIYKQVTEVAPRTKQARWAAGQLRQIDDLGKPFELEFNDYLTGRHVSVSDMKGKVVVVLFWASYSAPCQTLMPDMVKLYEEFRDKGVEFVGISEDIDENRLKQYLQDENITWPQYFDKKKSKDYAESWGLLAVPEIFLVDREGRLVNTKARGKLRELIPALLEPAEKSADE